MIQSLRPVLDGQSGHVVDAKEMAIGSCGTTI